MCQFADARGAVEKVVVSTISVMLKAREYRTRAGSFDWRRTLAFGAERRARRLCRAWPLTGQRTLARLDVISSILL